MSMWHCCQYCGRTVYGVGQRPLACWDCWFESRRRHGCLSVVGVVCCQVEVSETSWSLLRRSPTECDLSECDREASMMRRPWPTGCCCATKYSTGGIILTEEDRSTWRKTCPSTMLPTTNLTLGSNSGACAKRMATSWWRQKRRVRVVCTLQLVLTVLQM